MGSTFTSIDDALSRWIAQQHMFFVATAPLSATGHVNCSPKGGNTFRVIGTREVAYLDGAGSGIETISHVRENGRLVLMFCAFDGAPRIVRLHGIGTVVTPTDTDFLNLSAQFPAYPTVRAIVRMDVRRVSDSCGYGVPLMDFRADRSDSKAYLRKSSDEALHRYLLKNNQTSVDGLTGLSPKELERLVIDRS